MILLLFSNSLHAEPMRAIENLRGETVFVPLSAPDKGRLILVGSATIAQETEIIGEVAMYDDARTKRSVDYLELYDNSGYLLWVKWIDRFGIRRTAMDLGLLQEKASGPEGVLVLLLEGNFL